MNTFQTSETTAKLDAALAKAQGEFGSAMKDSPNPAFKSKYANISSVLGAVRPALCKHGIAVTQWPVHTDNNRLHLITRLAHDGEWIVSEFSFPVEKQTAHGHGSAITYARRYALAAVLGVIDEDDDGNAATQGVAGNDYVPMLDPPPAKGNRDISYAKTTGTTPGALRAQENNSYFAKKKADLQAMVNLRDLREWWDMNERELSEKCGPIGYGLLLSDKVERENEFAARVPVK